MLRHLPRLISADGAIASCAWSSPACARWATSRFRAQPRPPMHTRSDEFDTATASLAADGWCVLRGLMSRAQTRALTNECVAMHDAQQLMPARVGADRDHTRLRGDSTH